MTDRWNVKVPAEAVTYDGVVPFHDCDPLGIVWHGHYVKYLELGRTELMKHHRLDVPDFIELGLRLVVTDLRCRYAFPLRYDERYRVHAWFVSAENQLHIGYEITNLSENRRALRARTTLATTDGKGVMFWETPPAVLERIAAGRRAHPSGS